jgi:hypothetical protein
MKAQAINIDFTIALALFLFTAAGTIAAVQAQRGDADTAGRSLQVADRIQTEVSTQVYRRELLLSSPTHISNYPVDKNLEFATASDPAGISFGAPARVNISTGKFVSVPALQNNSLTLSYLSADTSGTNPGSDNDITVQDNSYLNNSEIRLSLADPGLEAMIDRDLGRDLVRERGNISLPGTDLSTQQYQLSASSLSGALKVYNGSPEFIVEDGPVKFRLENLSTVFVLNGNRTLEVDAGFDRTFSTRALVITESPSSAESGGLVLAGDLSVTVTNVTSGVDVDASFTDRLRVRLVDGLSEGFRRSVAERGHAKFGPATSLSAGRDPYLADLSSLSDSALRTRLDIGQDLDYNISLGSFESVTSPSWEGINRGTAVENGDLVLNSTQQDSNYTEQYPVDFGASGTNASVRDVTVSVEDIPDGVNLQLQLRTPYKIYSGRNLDLSEGTQTFSLRTRNLASFEIRFVSSRAGGDGNWTVNSYEVAYSNALERGATLPPRGDVDAETQVLPFVDASGSVSPSVLEVRTWN